MKMTGNSKVRPEKLDMSVRNLICLENGEFENFCLDVQVNKISLEGGVTCVCGK